jgi:hypothetical protein
LNDRLPGSGERRQFLGQLVAGTAALAAASCARAQVAAQSIPPSPAPPPGAARSAGAADATTHQATPAHPTWDLSWTDHLTGTHRQVFDAPEIADGTVLHQARLFYTNYKDVYSIPEADLRAVLVIRHRALPMVLGDAVWNHYDFIGKKFTKLKDPTTGAWARRNPFLNPQKDDKYTLISPDGGFEAIIARGAIVLACNLAFNGFAGLVAERTKQTHEAVLDEFKASLVSGVTLVPSGVFGVIRAEQGGCSYLRST